MGVGKMTVYNIRKYKDAIKKTKVGSIEKIRVLGYTYYRVIDLNGKSFIRKSLISIKELLQLSNIGFKELQKYGKNNVVRMI